MDTKKNPNVIVSIIMFYNFCWNENQIDPKNNHFDLKLFKIKINLLSLVI